MKMKYLIVQPWYIEPGHPAQSLIRTYRAVRGLLKVKTVVYIPRKYALNNSLKTWLDECQAWQVEAPVLAQKNLGTLATGTIFTTREIHLKKVCEQSYEGIFYLDANLYILSLSLRIFPLHVNNIDVLCMVGPEFYQRDSIGKYLKWPLVKKLFSISNFKLFLRTQELAESWKEALPKFQQRIDYLPSLELQEMCTFARDRENFFTKPKKYLVSGQIRRQKSVNKLVKLFSQNAELGTLTLAGKIINPDLEVFLTGFCNAPNIIIKNEFLSEHEMFEEFSHTHYNLMLYEDWDTRMESAMLFESIKYSCPIISYSAGWLGRHVNDYKLGWTVPQNQKENIYSFLKGIPNPGSEKYNYVLGNIKNFYDVFSSTQMVESFLEKLGWKTHTS